MKQSQYLIYGASDDLLEVEDVNNPGVMDEFDAYDGATVRLTAPTGETLEVTAKFTIREWELTATVTSDSGGVWTVEATHRPDRPEDPALLVTGPEGTSFARADAD